LLWLAGAEAGIAVGVRDKPGNRARARKNGKTKRKRGNGGNKEKRKEREREREREEFRGDVGAGPWYCPAPD